MAYETIQGNKERVTIERLRKSMVKVIEYLHEEFDGFEDDEIPVGHIARDIETMARWCNQPEEQPKQTAYNGWENRETWLVALWLDNDRETANLWRNRANEILNEYSHPEDAHCKNPLAAGELAEELRDAVEPDDMPILGLHNDLLHAAFAEVCWHEIAMQYIEDIDR